MRADGFTFPELLVVMLIVGLLAAIALPTLTAHVDKGEDAAAKSNVASLSGLVEFCHEDTDPADYRACDTEAELSEGGSTGLPWGGAVGQVHIVSVNQSTYLLRARSKAGAAFTIARSGPGPLSRTCTPPGSDGCPSSGDW